MIMQKYIAITGVGLNNKGAQAMLYIAVDYINERYSNCGYKALIVSNDLSKIEDLDKYKFDVVPANLWNRALLFKVLGMSRIISKVKKGTDIANICEITNKTNVLLDLSGYVWGSNWGNNRVFKKTLKSILLPHLAKISVYLMPQSFGPFSFEGLYGKIVDFLLKVSFPKCKCIMAREKEGYELLKNKYNLNNVIKKYDVVLQTKEININNIFKNNVDIYNTALIRSSSIAVIPNSNLEKYASCDIIVDVYERIIRKLLDTDKSIYVVYHERNDYNICKKIKNRFADNLNVIFIEDELSCLDFGMFVRKMDFVVASRYHSIVHAYKSGIPAVIIGWATKYVELAEIFLQSGYLNDARKNIVSEQLIDNIEKMLENYQDEREKILEILPEIQNSNSFDMINV